VVLLKWVLRASGAIDMPTRNINLTDHFDGFVTKQIKEGRYKNASEVLRAGLRLLELEAVEERKKIEILRSKMEAAIREVNEGRGITFRNRRELNKFIDDIGDRVAKKLPRRAKGA
jgi:antitoxin ParD1/3/4